MLETRALDEDFHASLKNEPGPRALFGPMAASLNVSKPPGIM